MGEQTKMTKSKIYTKQIKQLFFVSIASIVCLAPLLCSHNAIAADPNILSIFAGTGNQGTPTPGPATSSDLSSPSGVAVDSAGNVYIADNANNVIEKVTVPATLTSNPNSSAASSTPQAPNTGFGQPTSGSYGIYLIASGAAAAVVSLAILSKSRRATYVINKK